MTTTFASARAAALPALALALALALLLSGCGDTPPTGTEASETAAPTAEAPEESGEIEETAPTVDGCGFTSDDYAVVRDALQAVDLADIRPYLADSVYVTYASSEYEGAVVDPELVLRNLEDVASPGVTWTFDIPAADMAVWSASEYYAEDFTECAIVGITSADRGVSLTVEGGEITRELITFSIEAWGY